VEDYDKKILSNPQKHIINKGGSIFFAKKDKKIVGVVALMPTHELDVYELTKMGVEKNFRNQGVGRQLLKKGVEQAKLNKLKKVIIYSNRKLENAIYLYKSFGFIEVELEKNSNYQRADIKLELRLQ
jgi:N-acetylglutamate synthase-like GNAT family acetyltransferase